MERICFALQVRPDKLVEYEERHRSVWPAMKQALVETGWTNYSLFLRDDGLLIGYLETDDFAQAKQRMQAREVDALWQQEMRGFFVEPAVFTDGSGPRPLKQVFHLP